MGEFNPDRLKDALDFFIFKRFSEEGPLSALEIQQRAKPIHTLLDSLASRKGKQSLGSLLTALQRLQREGWFKAEPQFEDGPELVYALTVIGEQRIKEESARRGSILSQFIEDGEMEKSFRKFLDRRGPPGGN